MKAKRAQKLRTLPVQMARQLKAQSMLQTKPIRADEGEHIVVDFTMAVIVVVEAVAAQNVRIRKVMARERTKMVKQMKLVTFHILIASHHLPFSPV